MKIQVTHLKAPWPDGTKVGDVLEVGDRGEVPAAFIGKFQVVDEGKPAASVAAGAPDDAEELAIERNLRKAAEEEAAELRGRLEAMTAERDKAANDLTVANADVARVQAELEKASTKPKR